MKNTLGRILLGLSIGLAAALGINSIIPKSAGHPALDQYLLLFITASAFGYLSYQAIDSWTGRFNLPRLQTAAAARAGMVSFIREHSAGLLLAVLFFVIYLHLGLRLNFPTIDTVDNFLDADNTTWMMRIAAPGGSRLEMRGPHPFAFLILRPLGWTLNLFTNDYAHAAILLNSLSGAFCVFLAWVFINRQLGDRIYALLTACLLGLCTSHLFFSAVVESYIFSAAALIGFCVLVQSPARSMGSQVAVGLLTFGITLTNFVQNFIAAAVSRPKIKDLIRFAGLTISLGVLLSLIHAWLYPASRLFFLPSNAQAEENFTISVFKDPFWRGFGRVLLLVRTILLYTIIAPQPYVFVKEVGGEFPRFNFFKIVPGTFSYSSYEGLGNILVITWTGLILVSLLFFISQLYRTRKPGLELAFILCLLFNFLLHLNYGYEPFLYSPDWAYALIFFVSLALAPMARNRIFKTALVVFLFLLACNQIQFLQFIFHTIAPYLGRS